MFDIVRQPHARNIDKDQLIINTSRNRLKGQEPMSKTDKTTDIPPAAPRKWLATVRDIIGPDFISNLFGITDRSVIRWISLPEYTSEDSIRVNYLEKHETILSRLVNDGYKNIARAIVSRHAGLVGCSLVPTGAPTPDKDTIEEEMLDDYPVLVKLHQAIQNKKDMDTVAYLANEFIAEIYETVEKYKQDQN